MCDTLDKLKISVVIPTRGLVSGRGRLIDVIDSLLAQDVIVSEIVVVWQGDELPCFLQDISPKISILLMDEKGVSLARNCGGDQCKGDLILFLDDDCILSSHNVLGLAIHAMSTNSLDFVVANIQCIGKFTPMDTVIESFPITKQSVVRHMNESGFLIKRDLFRLFRFDPRLGVGCLHGSSEGVDLGARLLAAGFRGMKLHNYTLDHPPLPESDSYQFRRICIYSLGHGAALVMNGYYQCFFYDLIRDIVLLLKSIKRMDTRACKFYFLKSICMAVGPLIPRMRPTSEWFCKR